MRIIKTLDMKQKKLYLGIFFILLAILFLFFSPLFYHWFFNTFKIQDSVGTSLPVALSIFLTFIFIGAIGSNFIDEYMSNR